MATDNNITQGQPIPNVPHLRFPEFIDEWVEINCSDLLEFYSTNSLSWEQLCYDENELYNLHYGLIHVGLPTLVNVETENLPAVKHEFKPKNFTLCQNGDIAFADASEDTNEVAKPIEFFNCNDEKIVCGLHTIHGRDKLNVTEVGFKGYAFSATAFHHKIRRLAQGSKIYSISPKNFTEVTVSIPSKKEQQKIINLLLAIDERIATQIKIIEDLKTLKSAISKKIFSDKKLLPICIKLSEVATLRNGYAFQSNSYQPNSTFSIITIANVSGDRYINSQQCNTINELPEDIQEHQIIKENDILVSLTGNVGRVSLCKQGDFLLNQRVGLIDVKDIELSEYIYQILSTSHFEQTMISRSQGAAQMNISKSDVEEYELPYTTNTEVIKTLTTILQSYDYKIIIEQTILSDLQQQKQYLLNNMFI